MPGHLFRVLLTLVVPIGLVVSIVAAIASSSGSADALAEGVGASLTGAFASPVTWVVVILLVLATFVGLGVLARARQANALLGQWGDQLRSALASVPPGGLDEAARGKVATVTPHPEVLQRIGERWKELQEGLVEAGSGRWGRVQPAEVFLPDEDLLNSVGLGGLRFSSLRTLPSVLTGLGLLGTFVGVAVGLGQIPTLEGGTSDAQSAGGAQVVTGSPEPAADVELAPEEPVLAAIAAGEESEGGAFMNAVRGVIAGLASAFWTSVFGLSLALWFTATDNLVEERLLRTLAEVRETVDRGIPRVSSETLLRQQMGIMGEQRALLSAIRDEAEDSRGHLQQLASDLVDKLGERFDASLQTHLAPQLGEMTQLVREQVSTTTDKSVESARRFTEDMVSNISGALTDSFHGMVSAVGEFGTRFEAMAGQLDEVVGTVRAAVQEQREVLAASRAAVASAQEGSRTAANDLAATQKAAAAVVQLLRSLAQAQAQAGELQTRQVESARESEERVHRMTAQLGESAAVYERSAGQLQQVVPQLHGGLETLTTSVQRLVDTTEAAGNRLAAAVASLQSRLGEESQLLAGYREASASFSTALEGSRGTFAALSGAASALEATRGRLQELTGTLTHVATRVGGLAELLEGGVREASGAMTSAAKGMAGVVSDTEAWAAQATQAVERFASGLTQAVEASLREYDGSLSAAVDGLGRVMRELEDLAEQVTDAAAAPRRPGLAG